MPHSFLTAQWSNLLLLTYAVPPRLLEPRLPAGLELDLRDGQAFVSLVAFDFIDTRVLGVPWPGFRSFAEMNLRFYVRRGSERGVVFVREIVPQRLVAWVARTLYNEPYDAAPLRSTVVETPEQLTVVHRLHWGGKQYTVAATGKKPAYIPAENGTEHFFKEHQWGFGTNKAGATLRYRVSHPHWAIYPVQSYRLEFDWAQVYGPEWGFLEQTEPYSTVLAAGSPITVYLGEQIEHSPK